VIVTALILQSAELLAGASLWFKVKRDKARQILLFGSFQPTKIPILDHQLDKLAGSPTKTQRALSERLVKVTRKLVNTKAFEHAVTAIVNTRSILHTKLHSSSPTVLIP
jgi:hypothetical protein